MASVLQDWKQLQSDWKSVCNAKNHQKIISFFDMHKNSLLSTCSWFLENLCQSHDIEAMKYVFQQCDIEKFINLQSDISGNYPLMFVCAFGTFEMIKLFVLNGAEYVDKWWQTGYGLICRVLWNKTMVSNDIYLSIDYLMSINPNGIAAKHILEALSWGTNVSYDPTIVAKLIESKITFISQNLSAENIRYVIANKKFKFLQFLIDDYSVKLDSYMFGDIGVKYADKTIIEWLLKH
eukprot:375696_1